MTIVMIAKMIRPDFPWQIQIDFLSQSAISVTYAIGIFLSHQKAKYYSQAFVRALLCYHVVTIFTITACSRSLLQTKLIIHHASIATCMRLDFNFLHGQILLLISDLQFWYRFVRVKREKTNCRFWMNCPETNTKTLM